MNYENIRFEMEGDCAVVTIDRPEVMNALNHQTLVEMRHAFDRVKEDASIRAVVVTGEGEKAFVAGADINELARVSPLEARELALFGQQTLGRLERLGKPSVAMVNGFALGGGMELALACNLRTASTNARMGLPEVSLGIIPGYGGTQRLSRIASPGVALEWILTGDVFPVDEAYRVGIINRLFEPEDLRAGTFELVEKILSRAPVAVRLGIEAINRGINVHLQEGEEMERDMFGLSAATEDMREGMAAFLEKRKAEFKGK